MVDGLGEHLCHKSLPSALILPGHVRRLLISWRCCRSALVFIAYLVIGLALPVLSIHVHEGLSLGTFAVGLVVGSQFAASLASRLFAGHHADHRGPSAQSSRWSLGSRTTLSLCSAPRPRTLVTPGLPTAERAVRMTITRAISANATSLTGTADLKEQRDLVAAFSFQNKRIRAYRPYENFLLPTENASRS